MKKHCDWCDHLFETQVSYQIYCSPECREAATKEKIAKRYQEKRRHNPNRKLRTCKKCDKKLSIYNDDPLCQECLVNPKEVLDALKNIKGLADGKTNINNE